MLKDFIKIQIVIVLILILNVAATKEIKLTESKKESVQIQSTKLATPDLRLECSPRHS